MVLPLPAAHLVHVGLDPPCLSAACLAAGYSPRPVAAAAAAARSHAASRVPLLQHPCYNPSPPANAVHLMKLVLAGGLLLPASAIVLLP